MKHLLLSFAAPYRCGKIAAETCASAAGCCGALIAENFVPNKQTGRPEPFSVGAAVRSDLLGLLHAAARDGLPLHSQQALPRQSTLTPSRAREHVPPQCLGELNALHHVQQIWQQFTEVCRWIRAGVTARPGPAGPMCDCLTPTTEARASAGAPASPGGTRGPATDARPSGFAYPPPPMPPLQSNGPRIIPPVEGTQVVARCCK